MNPMDMELIEVAKSVTGGFSLGDEFSAGGVGAAIRSDTGKIYTGICIDLGCGLGFCAEVSAIAQMLTSRETRIDTVVAVTLDGVIPPCGRCRETMVQIDRNNLDATVIIGDEEKVTLRELLPSHWLE